MAEDGTTMQFMTADEIAQGVTAEVAGTDFLTSGVWQWTSTDDPLGVTAIDDPEQYTISFNPDGSAAIQADCNVLATYAVTDGGG
ncbi:MAG: hypothetical protein R3C44_21915 [Chloroflexota bacterium]